MALQSMGKMDHGRDEISGDTPNAMRQAWVLVYCASTVMKRKAAHTSGARSIMNDSNVLRLY